MWKLFIKDIRVNREYLGLMLSLLAAISFGFSLDIVPDVEIYVLVVILSSLITSKLFLIMDETTQTVSFFASLPITRAQLVLSRYLSSFLCMMIALAVHLVVIHLSASTELQEEAAFLFRPGLWIITPVLLILSDAFSFPFFFRYGFVRGAFFYGLTLIMLMIFTVMAIRFYVPQGFAQHIIHWVSERPFWLIVAAFLTIVSMILGGSVLISIHTFKRQDI